MVWVTGKNPTGGGMTARFLYTEEKEMKKHAHRFKQLISGIFISALILYASPASAKAPQVYTLKLPKEACNVKERWRGSSKKTVVYVQDAHNNIDAQENIATIIETLVNENKVELVGIEGSSDTIDFSDLRTVQSPLAKDIVTDAYLQRGILIGAEKAAISSPDQFTLTGIEDWDLFRKNFRAYFGTQLKREDILEQLEEIEHILNDLKTPVFNEALRTFDGSVVSWERGDMSLVDFLGVLHTAVADRGIETLDYINYAAFQDALQLRSRVLEVTKDEELKNLESLIAERLAEEKTDEKAAKLYREFIALRAQFMQKQLSEREYIEFLYHASRAVSVDFNTYRQLNLYLSYLRAFSRLDMEGVVRDVRKLVDDIRLNLARTDEERTLIEQYHRFVIVRQMASLTATVDQVTEYQNDHSSYEMKGLVAYTQRECEKYGLPFNIGDTAANEVDTLIAYAAHFYVGAELRNAALVKNALRAMDTHGDTTGVIVAGGFHTSGIVEELKQRDISYLVVTPKIDTLDTLAAYDEKMRGNLVALSPQLVGYINIGLFDGKNRAGGSAAVRATKETMKNDMDESAERYRQYAAYFGRLTAEDRNEAGIPLDYDLAQAQLLSDIAAFGTTAAAYVDLLESIRAAVNKGIPLSVVVDQSIVAHDTTGWYTGLLKLVGQEIPVSTDKTAAVIAQEINSKEFDREHTLVFVDDQNRQDIPTVPEGTLIFAIDMQDTGGTGQSTFQSILMRLLAVALAENKEKRASAFEGLKTFAESLAGIWKIQGNADLLNSINEEVKRAHAKLAAKTSA